MSLSANPKTKPLFSQNIQNLTLADPRATRALVALMDMEAVLGGAASHFGGPAALAELMSAAWGLMWMQSSEKGQNWHEQFHFVSDAGHCENGLYALYANCGFGGLSLGDLKGFRSIQSHLTGHGEAHLFPQAVSVSNGPLGSAMGPAQGLALGERLQGGQRLTLAVVSDGACMEGETREVLASLPGFAAKEKLAPFVLILSDNNTKLSGRIDEESFSMAPTFDSLETLGWKVIDLKTPHDLKACVDTLSLAFESARQNPSVPVVVRARTIKGFGVKQTSESKSGGHGFPVKKVEELKSFLDEIYGNTSWPEEIQSWHGDLCEGKSFAKSLSKNLQIKIHGASPTVEKVQVGVSDAMIAAKQKGLAVVSVSADLSGSTGVGPFQKKFPESSVDVGVAESNMISLASGLSSQGFVPIVDTFAQFGVTKGALPLLMAAQSGNPVIAIFSHMGFQDAADGASHQALGFVAMTAALPNTDVYVLSCSEEARQLVGQAIEGFASSQSKGDVPRQKIFFLGRGNPPLILCSLVLHFRSVADS